MVPKLAVIQPVYKDLVNLGGATKLGYFIRSSVVDLSLGVWGTA